MSEIDYGPWAYTTALMRGFGLSDHEKAHGNYVGALFVHLRPAGRKALLHAVEHITGAPGLEAP